MTSRRPLPTVRQIRAGAVGLAAGMLLVACAPSSVTPSATHSTANASNPFRVGRPLVIPHAGGDALFPENTLYAYEHSMAMGGDVIDADVRISADGVPIAMHDADVDRTTDGTGRVEDLTYAQLATLDAGYGFGDDGTHPFRGTGITVPTIESLLTAFPDVPVTLDLKDRRTAAVAPLCSLLHRLGRTDDVYVGTYTTEQVDQFRQLCPSLQTSGTDAERNEMRAARHGDPPSLARRPLVSHHQYTAGAGTLPIIADHLDLLHRHDIAMLIWTVDDPQTMKALIELGVDGIYTRRPDVMLALLNSLTIRDDQTLCAPHGWLPTARQGIGRPDGRHRLRWSHSPGCASASNTQALLALPCGHERCGRTRSQRRRRPAT